MSHLKERKDKNCLNCNAVVHGRYCSVCGQENLEPQESAGHLVSHFFNDITHFDGKFFSSLKYVLFNPGFLSEEYMAGRRASYLNPVRMYVFTSFIFFLLFFSFSNNDEVKVTRPSEGKHKREQKDTAIHIAAGPGASKDTIPIQVKDGNIDVGNSFTINTNEYRDLKQYDSLTDAGKVKDNFFKRWIVRKELRSRGKYGDRRAFDEKLVENFKHNVPQIFFLSLPLLALALKLLYIRRKRFYYVAHAIFSIHLFIFTYIAVLIIYGLDFLSDLPYMSWISVINILAGFAIVYYWYKAMRNFYGQSRWKTIIKFILVIISLLIIFSLTSLLILLFSYYKT